MAVDYCEGLFIRNTDRLIIKFKYMDNQPKNQANTGNNDDDKKEDTKDQENEPKVYQGGNSSNTKHNNESKP